MKIGFVPLLEADAFLYFQMEALDLWTDFTEYPLVSGKLATIGISDIVTGENTLFQTEITVGQYLDLGYNLVRVTEIHSDIEIKVNRLINLPDKVSGKKITDPDYARLKDLYFRKVLSLTTAYRSIISSRRYTIDSENTDEDVKKAQSILALHLFNSGLKQSKHIENQEIGIKSYSIGDMSYSYDTKLTENFPHEVVGYLKNYSNFNQTPRLERRPLKPNTFLFLKDREILDSLFLL